MKMSQIQLKNPGISISWLEKIPANKIQCWVWYKAAFNLILARDSVLFLYVWLLIRLTYYRYVVVVIVVVVVR